MQNMAFHKTKDAIPQAKTRPFARAVATPPTFIGNQRYGRYTPPVALTGDSYLFLCLTYHP